MIIGDSGYPNLSKLICPFKRDASVGPHKCMRRKRYNKRLSKGRIIVENTIGALKMRFPVLKNKIRVHRKNFSHLVMGSIILHNVMNMMGIPLLDEEAIA